MFIIIATKARKKQTLDKLIIELRNLDQITIILANSQKIL